MPRRASVAPRSRKGRVESMGSMLAEFDVIYSCAGGEVTDGSDLQRHTAGRKGGIPSRHNLSWA